jgi:NusA-like KH domain protein
MNKILYDNDLIQVMSLFTTITRVPLKDCYYDETKVTFVIMPGYIRQAIGPNNTNIKKLELRLQKKIRVVEFNDDIIKFIKNMILPFRVNEIVFSEEGIVVVRSDDVKTKSLIIGKNARNLRALELNVQRYFQNLKEIKVE